MVLCFAQMKRKPKARLLDRRNRQRERSKELCHRLE